jgi:hypothetical protein
MMALQPCRECGKDVSQSAKSCPHCGVAYPANKLAAAGASMTQVGCALTLLVTVPLLLLLAFC